MARPKKIKQRQYAKLRTKQLANGETSLYLDIYKDGQRKYEFLDMRLLPETDARTKERNRKVLVEAEVLRAERDREAVAAHALDGLGNATKYEHLPLQELADIYKQHKTKLGGSKSSQAVITAMAKHLSAYNEKAELKDLDKNFVRGFVAHLRAARKKNGEQLDASAVACYFSTFRAILNYAVKQEWLSSNPVLKLDTDERVRRSESTREFLTAGEVKRMMDTPLELQNVKNAFLFSCFCGLRLSDIRNLTFGDLHTDNGQTTARIRMKKTKRELVLPLCTEACKCIPTRSDAQNNDHVFSLPSTPAISRWLDKWTTHANIDKHVTFHVARHTFATLGLTADVPITVVSSLLGHAAVTTTQIYAKVIDKKKVEAVNKLGALFG